MKRLCRDCEFWNPQSQIDELGECRRHPPTILPTIFDDEEAEVLPEIDPTDMENLSIHSVWPVTSFAGWCGDFREKE